MDYTKQGNMNVLERTYVHSKVRNFEQNRTEISMYSLGKQIDFMMKRMFRDAIRYAEIREKEVFSAMGVGTLQELEELSNLRRLQENIVELIDMDAIIEQAVKNNTVSMDRKYQMTELKMTFSDALTEINQHYSRILTTNFDKLSKGDVSIVREPGLSYIMDSIRTGTRIDFQRLREIDRNLYGYERELQAAVDGMVSLEAQEYTDFVVESLQKGFDEKQIRDMEREHGFTIEPKIFSGQGLTETRFPSRRTDDFGLSVRETVSFLAQEIGSSADNSLEYMTYLLANILSFGTSGGVSPNGENIESYSFQQFSDFGDCVDILQKTSLYWMLGKDFEEQIFGDKLPAILVVGKRLIPLSEVLRKYEEELFLGVYNDVDFTSIPRTQPKELWSEKEQAIASISSGYYEKGIANYPEPLLSVGATVGESIARATQINSTLFLNIETLLNR